MVGFAGAEAAQACAAMEPARRDEACLRELAKLYPGIEDEVAGKLVFMDWGNEPWTKASYSFPAPGQITTTGPLLHRGFGRLHFAGEHTCYKFVGYMEGALSSGVALAGRLAQRDGVAAEKAPPSAVR
jgi:monoamine oxidase